MIIDSEGRPVSAEGIGLAGTALPRLPWSVKAIWILSFVALIVGVAAAAAFALWIALILIPLAILVSGIASIIYRLRWARARKAGAVVLGGSGQDPRGG